MKDFHFIIPVTAIATTVISADSEIDAVNKLLEIPTNQMVLSSYELQLDKMITYETSHIITN